MLNKKFKFAVTAAFFTCGIAVLVAGVASTQDDASNAKKPAVVAARAALSVTTTTPTTVAWPQSLTANGNIVAWQEVVIGAEIGGLRLTEVLANVGDHVNRGELLARIAGETVEAELAQANAAVAEAEAMQAEAVANADRARHLQSSGVMSAQQIVQALTAEQTAKARVAAAQARVMATELRLAQTQVFAPDHGVIATRTATVGSLAQPGQELFRLIRKNRLEWRAEITAAELSRVHTGQVVNLELVPGVITKGRVRIVAPTVDPLTRIGLVYVDLPTGGPARAGTFARGEFELSTASALTLPQSAVLLREGFSYVFRVNEADQVTQTKVAIGRRIEDRIAITDGLDANARVVASGVGFLADGDTVRIVDAPLDPARK